MYWVEIRSGVRRSGKPKLVPLSEVHKHTGFRSVFAYDDVTAAVIRDTGSTRGLNNISVYCDVLLLDFDGRDSDDFEKYLQSLGVGYERADSGNRSDHYHIPIRPIEGTTVPAACKDWVHKHAPTADLSFYHPSGQYRLTGTFHAKRPGHRKEIIRVVQGPPLELPAAVSRPPIALSFGDERDTSSAQQFTELMLKPYNPAIGRRPHLFQLAITGFDAGMDEDAVLDACRWWNENMSGAPHDDTAVVTQVSGALKYAARKKVI